MRGKIMKVVGQRIEIGQMRGWGQEVTWLGPKVRGWREKWVEGTRQGLEGILVELQMS